MNTFDALKQFYESYDEDNRLTSRHGSVEYRTTMRYIEKYLRPGMRILEIGAATGRYSHTFARQGYRVDAVELLEHNIEIFKANTQADENITVMQGNATDLSAFADDNSFLAFGIDNNFCLNFINRFFFFVAVYDNGNAMRNFIFCT